MSDPLYFRFSLPVLEGIGFHGATLGRKKMEATRVVDHEQEYLDSQLRFLRGEREQAAPNAPYLRYLAHLTTQNLMDSR